MHDVKLIIERTAASDERLGHHQIIECHLQNHSLHDLITRACYGEMFPNALVRVLYCFCTYLDGFFFGGEVVWCC